MDIAEKSLVFPDLPGRPLIIELHYFHQIQMPVEKRAFGLSDKTISAHTISKATLPAISNWLNRLFKYIVMIKN